MFPVKSITQAFVEKRLSYRTAARLFERFLCLEAIKRTGSRKEAARIMQIDAKTFYRITHWKLERAKMPDGLLRLIKSMETKAVIRTPKKEA